ncbi:uncharacterized protein LOC130728210 isoform X1 [Lotus japonicus]|uniref:uncharacterized protein LOC130728210 isoform X1 n=1 Tax=Lotus japonicus TaxID=34305 RepID=UPI00258AC175|nr:uncharacterized protein LOC130728210 isoform X1 [Lotus japonicus]
MTMQRRRRRRRSTAENPSLSSVLLPDELIEAILVRLPVSSLLRFKSVCKSWLSVISDPQFAKSQFDLAASPTHRLLLSVTDDLKFQSLDIDSSPPNDDESAVLNYPREQQPYSHGKSLSKIAQSPDLAQQLNNKPYDLREMAGCLALCYSAYGEMAEMWIMKEYKVQSSWTKIVFSTHDESPCFFPICFTKCGDVFGSDEFGRLLRLNDKGKLLPVYPWDWSWESRYRLLYSRMYTASILSLPS